MFQLYLPTHHFPSPVLALLQAVRQHRLFLLRVPVARHPGLCPDLVPPQLPGHQPGGRGQGGGQPARLQEAGGRNVSADGEETPRPPGHAPAGHVQPQQLLLLCRHAGLGHSHGCLGNIVHFYCRLVTSLSGGSSWSPGLLECQPCSHFSTAVVKHR